MAAPLSTFWIWLVQHLNAPGRGEELGKTRFLIQSGCAAWFYQDPCVCASRAGMVVFTALWSACPLSQSGDTAVPKVPVTAAGSPSACHREEIQNTCGCVTPIFSCYCHLSRCVTVGHSHPQLTPSWDVVMAPTQDQKLAQCSSK